MKQSQFIYNCNRAIPGENSPIHFDIKNGNVNVTLSASVKLVHSYSKNDMICLEFTDMKEKYILQDDKQLNDILDIVVNNKNIETLLREFAKENMKEG